VDAPLRRAVAPVVVHDGDVVAAHHGPAPAQHPVEDVGVLGGPVAGARAEVDVERAGIRERRAPEGHVEAAAELEGRGRPAPLPRRRAGEQPPVGRHRPAADRPGLRVRVEDGDEPLEPAVGERHVVVGEGDEGLVRRGDGDVAGPRQPGRAAEQLDAGAVEERPRRVVDALVDHDHPVARRDHPAQRGQERLLERPRPVAGGDGEHDARRRGGRFCRSHEDVVADRGSRHGG
jgi:hypothetical protein